VGEKRRLTRKAVHDMIQRYGKRHGIPDDELHPHAFRHRFGTELAEGDVSLVNIQDLMGHADPKSTACTRTWRSVARPGSSTSTDRWPRCARRSPTCSSACHQADPTICSRATPMPEPTTQVHKPYTVTMAQREPTHAVISQASSNL
jgi:hypothetical protein